MAKKWILENGFVLKITETEETGLGYHGTDTHPCDWDYLADAEDGGYYVYHTDPETLTIADGWTAEEIDLETTPTAYLHDGTQATVFVEIDKYNNNQVVANGGRALSAYECVWVWNV